LLDAFSWTCKQYGGRKGAKLAREYDRMPSADDWTEEETERAEYLLEDMTECLDALCPDYVTFGAHEGDGADFGFWVAWDSLEDAERSGEILKTGDLSEVPNAYRGYVMKVNDHGNATLYYKSARKFRELWAVV
jgi:hypothetical protein